MVMGAALAQGDSVVSRVLESKDLERTMAILRGDRKSTRLNSSH